MYNEHADSNMKFELNETYERMGRYLNSDLNYREQTELLQLAAYFSRSITSYFEEKQRDFPVGKPFLKDADHYDILSYGQCGDNVYWKVLDYVLYISGTGEMWDFGIEDCGPMAPWWKSDFEGVVISEGVTSIGAGAFEQGLLERLEIPDSVKIIKENAFFDTTITRLELRDTIQTIEPYIIAADPCRVSTLVVSANIPNIMPSAFYSRYLAPDEIILTGDLPDSLSALVASELFVWPCPRICYPKAWDTEAGSFYEKLAAEIKVQGEVNDIVAYDESDFEKLRNSLCPVE